MLLLALKDNLQLLPCSVLRTLQAIFVLPTIRLEKGLILPKEADLATLLLFPPWSSRDVCTWVGLKRTHPPCPQAQGGAFHQYEVQSPLCSSVLNCYGFFGPEPLTIRL